MVLLLSALGLGIYLFFHYDIYTFFIYKEKALAFINSFGPLSALVFILLQIVQVVAAPIPGEVSGFIGGYLYGPILGTIYSTVGLSIGSWLAFVLARTFGLPLVEKIISGKIIGKYDYFMEHKGILVSFLLFLVPGFPKDALCYIIGLSRMGTRTFIAISTAGRLLGTIMLSLSGSFARNDQTKQLIIVGIIGLIIAIVAYFRRDVWLKYFKSGQKTK
jgi:uncharacterized membrane protein YdjX (TVP38/TMEM64 family)